MAKKFLTTVEPRSTSLIRYRIAIYSYYEAIFCIKINMKINNPFHPQNVCFYV